MSRAASIWRTETTRRLWQEDPVCPDCGRHMDPAGIMPERPVLREQDGQPVLVCFTCLGKSQTEASCPAFQPFT